jgi:hypothetical protein
MEQHNRAAEPAMVEIHAFARRGPVSEPAARIPAELPLRARIAAYLSPWQIAAVLIVSALILLAIPTLLFWWELAQTRAIPR